MYPLTMFKSPYVAKIWDEDKANLIRGMKKRNVGNVHRYQEEPSGADDHLIFPYFNWGKAWIAEGFRLVLFNRTGAYYIMRDRTYKPSKFEQFNKYSKYMLASVEETCLVTIKFVDGTGINIVHPYLLAVPDPIEPIRWAKYGFVVMKDERHHYVTTTSKSCKDKTKLSLGIYTRKGSYPGSSEPYYMGSFLDHIVTSLGSLQVNKEHSVWHRIAGNHQTENHETETYETENYKAEVRVEEECGLLVKRIQLTLLRYPNMEHYFEPEQSHSSLLEKQKEHDDKEAEAKKSEAEEAEAKKAEAEEARGAQ
ncbi:hypothetical protein B0T17DRAFT_543821 [Bombardia bombarda]|uniref:Uncharacterized protein n=1 Tax=Bombardia bombarda TaxID=252184 RepID=A0AA39TU18_9PEZI|nr:hypothetical protein B0T17DRAFT_543821 [Bombardia bombarda]